jgi:hypothetical protein
VDVEITPELVLKMAEVAGFEVPPGDLDALTLAVASQIETAESLQAGDFSDVPPITTFDPRW